MVKAARPYSCTDPTVVDEMVQETYVRLCTNNFKSLRGLKTEHPNGIFAFIQSIAYTTAVDYFRKQGTVKRGRNQLTVSLDGLMREVASASGVGNALERTLLLEEIDSYLDEILAKDTRQRDRTVFWLYHRQGFTALEISQLTEIGLTVKGVESLLKRMLDEIKLKFQKGITGKAGA